MARTILSATERDRVTAAVAAAEAGTDGEIVTIVADRSDAYHDVALHHAVVAMLAVTAIAAMSPGLFALDGGWQREHVATDLFALLIAQVLAFLLVRGLLSWTRLRLLLTPTATKARRVRRRALEHFRVGTEHRTAGREGVLLYLSAAEHRAEIVADAAVHGAVPAEQWGDAMAALVGEVRAGRTGEGMAAAIGAIGAILAGHFPKTADNPNELPDRVIEL